MGTTPIFPEGEVLGVKILLITPPRSRSSIDNSQPQTSYPTIRKVIPGNPPTDFKR